VVSVIEWVSTLQSLLSMSLLSMSVLSMFLLSTSLLSMDVHPY